MKSLEQELEEDNNINRTSEINDHGHRTSAILSHSESNLLQKDRSSDDFETGQIGEMGGDGDIGSYFQMITVTMV